jgi:hypothetical protein
MRLIEIANPTDYTTSDAHMAKFLEQIEKISPVTIKNDGVPFPPRLKKRQQNDRPKSPAQR